MGIILIIPGIQAPPRLDSQQDMLDSYGLENICAHNAHKQDLIDLLWAMRINTVPFTLMEINGNYPNYPGDVKKGPPGSIDFPTDNNGLPKIYS